MTSKKLGVIGGMGSLATINFYERVIKNTVAANDQEHIDMVILNHATMPDRTNAILTGNGQLFLNAVKTDIELLEMAGAQNIAIPCNTSHYYYREMQSMTDINIINMVEDTARFVHDYYGEQSKVGILATDGTISTGVYKDACTNYQVEAFHPNTDIQAKVMDIIYHIKADVDYSALELEKIIQDMIKIEGCKCVILGCTELSTIRLSNEMKKYCIDPMEILAENAITLSGKNVKNPIGSERAYI
ncbi:aspartate/glutamate racemase family protein [Oceanobacillus bengalensis]|uniref:Amino acid racemase n=1 Tax=Oceanobacillus bengalensis TaxID=1435466 RepID=A0A494YXC7_9BACI|nr:amino acid racemase [Oceanobacillus bengalensis]RKQ14884.1 amino acid racemase [Oceanobacillus bengalensis]